MNNPQNIEPVPPFGQTCTGYRHRDAWRILERNIDRTSTGDHPSAESTIVCLTCACTWRQLDVDGIPPFSHRT